MPVAFWGYFEGMCEYTRSNMQTIANNSIGYHFHTSRLLLCEKIVRIQEIDGRVNGEHFLR